MSHTIVAGLCACGLLAGGGCSGDSSGQSTMVHARRSYASAIAAIAKRQAADDSIAVPGARSILLTAGGVTPRAILLLHGLTDSPRQFEALAYLLRADSVNVYVPRLPQHGLQGGTVRSLGALRASQLRAVADSVLDEARGLGDSVIVVGLSMGGTIAAWIGQHHSVTRAVLIAPALEPGRIPSMLDRPIIGLASRLPAISRASQPDTSRPDRELGINTRAFAEILALGESVIGDANHAAPATHAFALLLNASDRTINGSAAEGLAREWSGHGATVSIFELPDSLRLPHNIIDPPRQRLATDSVYALIRALADGQPPGGWVRRISRRGFP